MSVKFYLGLLRFARVICKKLIFSKYILHCHAYAWQRTKIWFLYTQGTKWPNMCWCGIKKLLTHSLYSQAGRWPALDMSTVHILKRVQMPIRVHIGATWQMWLNHPCAGCCLLSNYF